MLIPFIPTDLEGLAGPEPEPRKSTEKNSMLINCVAYQNGKKLADIPVADISEYINLPDTFVWVALLDATPQDLATMQEEFGLHELAVEDALVGEQMPKIEEYDNELFVVMHLIEMQGDELVVGEVNVFVGNNYVLSVRNRSSRSLLGVRARCEREPKALAKGPGYVFYALLDAVVDRYFPLIERIETELDEIEESIFTQNVGRDTIHRLYELKRKTTVIKHAVGPMLEAVSKLYSGRVHKVASGNKRYFRDVADHLARMNGTLDGIRDTISAAMQMSASLIAIDQTEVSKRLAAWASIFAAATAFAGIWGMNFSNMPELEWAWGYPLALGVIGTTSAVLFWRFRKLGWV